jgi:hypothetical protein
MLQYNKQMSAHPTGFLPISELQKKMLNIKNVPFGGRISGKLLVLLLYAQFQTSFFPHSFLYKETTEAVMKMSM